MGRAPASNAESKDPIQRADRNRLRPPSEREKGEERRCRNRGFRQEQGKASQKGRRKGCQGRRKGTETGRACGPRKGQGRQTGGSGSGQFWGSPPGSFRDGDRQKMDPHRGADAEAAEPEGAYPRVLAGIAIGRKGCLCQGPIDHVYRPGGLLPKRQGRGQPGHGQIHRWSSHRVHRRRRGHGCGSRPTRRLVYAKNGGVADLVLQMRH
mmetsp:Transcript_17504/g.35985  ORF Transcript_17504/g.35985 Transcript_17504/m.35985 type:complete len:209 (+) Transcript_17504:234-860(+)